MATSDVRAHPSPTDTGAGRGRGPGSAPLFLIAAIIAAVLAVGLTALYAGDTVAGFGLADPGDLTRYSLPVLRALAEIALIIGVGSLLLAAFLVPPKKTGELDLDGYLAVRTGSIAMAVWAGLALLLIPVEYSAATGVDLWTSMEPETVLTGLGQVQKPVAWLVTAIVAIIVAVGSRLIVRWGWTPFLLGGALLSLLPIAITGHSASGGAHDLGVNSLIWHLFGAALWAGGMFAVFAHARRRGAYTDVVIRRYSVVATASFIAVALSGIVNALIRMPLEALWTSVYGGLVLGKTIALVVLGVLGFLQRRSSVRVLQADPTARRPLIRLGLVESLVFAATMGLAVALSGAPPPYLAPDAAEPSMQEVKLGYEIPGPANVVNLLTAWRFDLIFGVLAILLAGFYLYGVWRLRRRGDSWPISRTLWWLAGAVILLLTTSSGVGRYMTAMFSVHMAAHMVLSMLVPVLLVLGTPVTLALRAMQPAGRDGVPGPREWLLAFVHSPVTSFLTHPLVAMTQFVLGFYGLYLGGIYDAIAHMHTGHLVMNVHFLLSGYLFYWVVLGQDPTPRRLAPVTRLGIVMATLPLHAFFGIALMMSDTVMGLQFYRDLDLDFVTDLLADQKVGGGITWASGELPLLLIMTALAVQWYRSDSRAATQHDRRADRDEDAELAAYNEMLHKMALVDAGVTEGDAETAGGAEDSDTDSGSDAAPAGDTAADRTDPETAGPDAPDGDRADMDPEQR